MDNKEKKQYLSNIKKFNDKKYKEYEHREKRKNVPAVEYIVKMRDDNNILEIDDLKTYFYTDTGTVKAVDGVTFDLPKGKTIGVVGESGCGKSVTSLSIMRLLQAPQGQISGGQIRYNGDKEPIDLTKVSAKKMQQIRGNDISMIFQEPMTSLNPVFTIGAQVDEVISLHNTHLSKNEVKNITIEMLKTVGIARADGIYKSYPHELSGGMRQRVVIAMALACNPKIIIADEPTTALDVTIQAQILDLLRELKDKINASIMLITHDLGVVAEMADYVVVMYAGRIIEQGTVREIFHNPSHPYTIGLMKSRPNINDPTQKLYSIPGNVPNPINLPNFCYFRNRCEKSFDKCAEAYPPLYNLPDSEEGTHKVCCYLYEEQAQKEASLNGKQEQD